MPLMAVADALARVLNGVEALSAEHIGIDHALGRVLAEDLASLRTQPPAAVSAMDGYAVRAEDVTQVPVTLKLIGEIAAGHPFEGEIKAGEAARIFTGGVMPLGSDTVVIQELAACDGNSVIVQKATARGRNVRGRGIDFAQGEVLLRKGTRLTDRDLMLTAAMNHAHLAVHRRPKIAVLGTGDELVRPGSTPRSGEIIYSNGYALMALAHQAGGDVADFGIARDRVEDIGAAVRKAHGWGADVLVTSGGASVGEHDLVQRALKIEGLDLSFWRVALRPGRPVMHGRLGPMHVLGVPGNPVSAYVCAFLFLVPLIARLTGCRQPLYARTSARLGCDLPANDEREDYLRATLDAGPETPVATPLPNQDSSLMAPLAAADCLLIREPFAPPANAGAPCVILKIGL